MGSFARTAGGIGTAAVLAGAALTIAQAPAQAARKVVTVPCSSPSLAAAITAANSTPTTLRLAANCTYNVTTAATATDALPVITGSVRLVGGPSTTIKRAATAPAVRILEVANGGALRVDGIFILDGAPAAGVAGAGIETAGSLTLSRVTLAGNATTGANGGGVDITSTGAALIDRTVIGANSAGGLGGGINNAGQLTLKNSRLSANSATSGGGGLATQLGATSRLVRSTLELNTTGASGGGIHSLGTTLVDHTLIRHNAATVSGGGVFKSGTGTVTVTTSTFSDNTPNHCFPLGTIPGCTG
jgi:hypothetical protein